jgi:hypothetical protein
MCYQFIGACKEPVMVIVTELLLGGTLRKYLLNMRPRCLDMRLAVGFALDIARAMECLHSHGIIHRDLKPGMINFWLMFMMFEHMNIEQVVFYDRHVNLLTNSTWFNGHFSVFVSFGACMVHTFSASFLLTCCIKQLEYCLL